MTAYDVTVSGCDASTRAFAIELDQIEHAALMRVAVELNNRAADVACAPTVTVGVTPPTPDTAWCNECFQDATSDQGLARDRNGEWCHAACVPVVF